MKPIQKLTSGRVSCAVWKNNDKLSYTFQYSYKDTSGKWQNTEFMPEYAVNDLLAIVIRLSNKVVQAKNPQNHTPTYPQPPRVNPTPSPTTNEQRIADEMGGEVVGQDQELPF